MYDNHLIIHLKRNQSMKHIVLFSILIFFGTYSIAQNNKQSSSSNKKVNLSFVASPQLTWFGTNDDFVESEASKFGFDFGISADIFIANSDRYALTTGLTILSAGGDLRYTPEQPFSFANERLQPGTVVSYNLSYLEIPFALKLRTSQFHRTVYWGQFGLTNLINISAKCDTSDDTFKNNRINDEVNLYNAALTVGGGIEYDLGGGNALRAALIYNHGFTDVTADSNDDLITLHCLKLQVGIIF